MSRITTWKVLTNEHFNVDAQQMELMSKTNSRLIKIGVGSSKGETRSTLTTSLSVIIDFYFPHVTLADQNAAFASE